MSRSAPAAGARCPRQRRARIAALNRAAQHAGLAEGELLSNARSKVLDLQTRDADPAADAAALRRLALWCLRYTPIVATWDEAGGADGLFLDITGCAHLFGGEERLLADLARPPARLRAFPAHGDRRARRAPPGRWRATASDGRIVASAAREASPAGPAARRAPLSARTPGSSCAGWACAASAR